MTSNYQFKIKLLSDTLSSSGVGWGGVVDSDIVFDEYGLPYIPARRIKGCLLEAATELREVCSAIPLHMESLFGKAGAGEQDSCLTISNACFKDYEVMRSWLAWMATEESNCNKVYSPEALLDSFTVLRSQTRIEDGKAKDHSLRTSRVLTSGLIFWSSIIIKDNKKNLAELERSLGLIAAVFRSMGTIRNRGFGKIKCSLRKGQGNITDKAIKELETLLKSGSINHA